MQVDPSVIEMIAKLDGVKVVHLNIGTTGEEDYTPTIIIISRKKPWMPGAWPEAEAKKLSDALDQLPYVTLDELFKLLRKRDRQQQKIRKIVDGKYEE